VLERLLHLPDRLQCIGCVGFRLPGHREPVFFFQGQLIDYAGIPPEYLGELVVYQHLPGESFRERRGMLRVVIGEMIQEEAL
jgi:hypothetical protein